jgi:hypothetical protein
LKNVREIRDDEYQGSDDQTEQHDIFCHRRANLIVADVIEKTFYFFGHERTLPIFVASVQTRSKKPAQEASGTFSSRRRLTVAEHCF